ncbi:hypothetical protein BKA67DRAFT_15029, partial [Truncatella angustata]
ALSSLFSPSILRRRRFVNAVFATRRTGVTVRQSTISSSYLVTQTNSASPQTLCCAYAAPSVPAYYHAALTIEQTPAPFYKTRSIPRKPPLKHHQPICQSPTSTRPPMTAQTRLRLRTNSRATANPVLTAATMATTSRTPTWATNNRALRKVATINKVPIPHSKEDPTHRSRVTLPKVNIKNRARVRVVAAREFLLLWHAAVAWSACSKERALCSKVWRVSLAARRE